ncbi:MAG: hypothetical protein EOP62_06120 [Sphingomonadales bacterium]|nr:MAG: hypothetical protein EOP62_06120 [Sphingomonadales bacterium]
MIWLLILSAMQDVSAKSAEAVTAVETVTTVELVEVANPELDFPQGLEAPLRAYHQCLNTRINSAAEAFGPIYARTEEQWLAAVRSGAIACHDQREKSKVRADRLLARRQVAVGDRIEIAGAALRAIDAFWKVPEDITQGRSSGR